MRFWVFLHSDKQLLTVVVNNGILNNYGAVLWNAILRLLELLIGTAEPEAIEHEARFLSKHFISSQRNRDWIFLLRHVRAYEYKWTVYAQKSTLQSSNLRDILAK